MRTTPDWLVELKSGDWDGSYPDDYDPCAEGRCDHPSHCEECGRGFDYELPDDFCLDCEIRWRASHQIGR